MGIQQFIIMYLVVFFCLFVTESVGYSRTQRSLPQICFQDWVLSYFAERIESMMVDPAQVSHAGHWCTQPVAH